MPDVMEIFKLRVHLTGLGSQKCKHIHPSLLTSLLQAEEAKCCLSFSESDMLFNKEGEERPDKDGIWINTTEVFW